MSQYKIHSRQPQAMQSDPWWKTHRDAVELAMVQAEQALAWAGELLHEEGMDGMQLLVRNWQQEAVALIDSYRYLLEAEVVAAAYRFGAWQPMAGILLAEMERTLRRFAFSIPGPTPEGDAAKGGEADGET